MTDVNKYLDTGSKIASLVGAGFALFLTLKYSGIKEEIATSQAALTLSISQMNKSQDSIDFELGNDIQHVFSRINNIQ